MAGIVSNDQWCIREKLCLASSVIRSGDQNWVSVSRAIKPFGESGRSPDWFSQKNCACQYSALLETVETPKRKRSERGEVVDTPGDLIVRKMTKERITELKAQLEEDKIRYRQLQREIEQIRCGQADERLQSMWDEIQEQKQAAKDAEEAQRLALETAKAAAAAKPASKLGFQSPNKRRPQAKNPRPGIRTQSETSSVGDNVEVDDNALTSPVKLTEEQEYDLDSSALISLVGAELEKDQDTVAILEEVATNIDSDETAEKLLAATASDLVDLLSPYPEDSTSVQSIDESSLPALDITTPPPTVKEPLILKIQKAVVKASEPNVEPNVPTSDKCQETEMINVDKPVKEQQPMDPHEGHIGNPEVTNKMQTESLKSSQTASQEANACQEMPKSSESAKTHDFKNKFIANNTDTTTYVEATEMNEPNPVPEPSEQATLKQKLRSPSRKSLSPEEQKAITKKLDAALYETPEQTATTPYPVRWLRSIQDRKKAKLMEDKTPVKSQEIRVEHEVDQQGKTPEKKKSDKKLELKYKMATAVKTYTAIDKENPSTEELDNIDADNAQPKIAVITEVPASKDLTSDRTMTCNKLNPTSDDATVPKIGNSASSVDIDQDKATNKSLITSARKRSPGEVASLGGSAAEADNNLASVTKSREDPGDDNYPQIEPPSPEDSSSRDDADMKVKKKGMRGRPPGSQRKSSRIRINAPMEEEEDHQPDTPSGRRSAGKDGTVSSIASFIGDDSKDDTHSEAGDSDVTDKPSESDRDDLSASAGALQSSFLLDSLPNSPASIAHSEEDHTYKIWRKAIMLVWRAIASHKYANVFLHPVTDDIAPGYKCIVLRPMDLITIKKNIENGMIRSIDQFHRDMMLMFQNAIMYNNADQHVHQIATIMQADVVKQIEEFVSTQLLVQQPDSTKMLRGRGKQGQGEEDRSRRNSTDTDTSGKKRRTRADEY